MPATFLDSVVYGDLWGSPSLRVVFDESARTRDWLEILAVLAEMQAAFDLVPARAAEQVAATCRDLEVDRGFLEEVRRGREATGHSTLGLIQAVQARCPGDSGEWLYYGATVQDLTDTWLARALCRAADHVAACLVRIDATLTDLARRHRDTLMPGRTHGQPGLPITFGFKAAGWLVEVRRHHDRLAGVGRRLRVGQLCGGVGSVSSLGPRGLEVQAAFCQRLGLDAPPISWTASRDVLAEWGQVLVLITGTADRIGHEVYTLQRAEIGEVREGAAHGVVGSITMPHKRNPEVAEHLGTLARPVRHLAGVLTEGLVHDHERDGRSWKAEWLAIPELTLIGARVVELLEILVADLEVDTERMRANVDATHGLVCSEAVMLALAPHTGKQTAHRLVYAAAVRAREERKSLSEIVRSDPGITAHLDAATLDAVLEPSAGLCAAMVDAVLGQDP